MAPGPGTPTRAATSTAWGATLYHALTGQAPMAANDRMAFPSQFTPVQELNPRVSSKTGETITQAMELAVENRFSTASEMSAALGRSEPAPRISAPSSAKPKRQPTKVLPGAQQAVASSRARLSRRQILYGALAAGGLVAGCSAAAAIATLVSQTNDKPPPTPTDKATKVNVVKETEIIIVEPHPTETPVEPVPIRWFIGLVTGSTPEEFDPREVFVDSFSTQHSEIELTVDIVDHEAASDTLKTLIAAGNPPDIVGPVGVRGSNEFVDSFLNLVRYLDSYDMSDFSECAIVGWTVPGAGLLGLPIGVYPSALYINRDLFDEAGLTIRLPTMALPATGPWRR